MFENRDKKFSQTSSYNDLNEISSKSLLANVLDINDDFGVITKKLKLAKLTTDNAIHNHITSFGNDHLVRENSSENPPNNNLNKSEMISLKVCLNLILNELKMISKKVKDDEDDENKILHWKFAAMVIDRLCMVFFALATLSSTIVILFTSKNFFRFK